MGRVVYNRNAFSQILKQPKVRADIARRTKAIADKSNSQSSWGGYNSEVDLDGDRPVGRVWSIGSAERVGSDRGLRLLKNLDEGRQ